ncbi:MAG: hypothetical protein DHS20C10_03430 [marine bacterium B5-7]|nr:MAG: hypothetical protein DHS20C10_03430 [marine bacterium B5-7]
MHSFIQTAYAQAQQDTTSNFNPEYAAKRAYALSMPVFAAALAGDAKQYVLMLPKFKGAISCSPDNAEKAWMLGRLLIAAKMMDADDSVLEKYRDEMRKILEPLNEQKDNAAMRAWAWAYLVASYDASTEASYIQAISAMATAGEYLSADASLTEKMWTTVMGAFASALANDDACYKAYAKTTLNEVRGERSLEQVFAALPADDYPAWLIASLQFAALKVNDYELYNDLDEPLTAAMKNAKSNDLMLAQATLVHATEFLYRQSHKLC